MPLFSIFHPSFNFDLEDVQDAVDRFENHVLAADKGTQGLRETISKLRESQKGVLSKLKRRHSLLADDALIVLQSTATYADSLPSTSSL